jgi:hypothetical protein
MGARAVVVFVVRSAPARSRIQRISSSTVNIFDHETAVAEKAGLQTSLDFGKTRRLVRNHKEKSNGVINFTHVEAFNNWINSWGLMKIKDFGRTYSWSNNQREPTLAKLDRILTSVDWECKYPLAHVKMLPKTVSDHSPLKIYFGDKGHEGTTFLGLRSGGWKKVLES